MNSKQTYIKNFISLTCCFLGLISNYSGLSQIAPNYNNEPPSSTIGYYKNNGQIVNTNNQQTDILYYSEGAAVKTYLRPDRVSFVKYNFGDSLNGFIDTSYQIDMIFACNEDLELSSQNCIQSISGNESTGETKNFFLPHCPNGIVNVPGYKRIVYENAWEDIDYHFYSNPSSINQMIVLNPGADFASIQIKFEGQDEINIDSLYPSYLDVDIAGLEHKFQL